MRFARVLCITLVLSAVSVSLARAEGFALSEWSARGVSMAGTMVGRANDASALAYNAAGITQLPGTHFMAGSALVAPLGTVVGDLPQGRHHTTTKPAVWPLPHAYVTHQLNDSAWLGLGVFSRFGLGNSYSGGWFGRYSVFDIGLQTVSAVPTLAYKVNDALSVSLGVEIMYSSMYMGNKIPTFTQAGLFDNDLQLKGQGWGFGAHLGLHWRPSDQWSVGLAYKSQVTLNLSGDADFKYEGANALTRNMHLPQARDSGVNSTLQLPDSLALGIAYTPLDNLSIEAGVTWTRWSTYNALNIYFDSGYASINDKEWRDGFGFNLGVEYKPLDWLTLRAGVSRETSVVNESYSDYMMPTNGRTTAAVGMGFAYNNWTLDLAYSHLWIDPVSYDNSRATMYPGHSENVVANVYMVSLGYSF